MNTNAALCGTRLLVLWTCTHPHAHPGMLLSQNTSKGEEGKPQGPEKPLHIFAAGLTIGSKGSLFLKQDTFFLSDRPPYPFTYGQGSFTVKRTMTKSGRRQCAEGAVPKQPSSIQVHLSFVHSKLLLNYCYCFPSEILAYATAKSLPAAALRSI